MKVGFIADSLLRGKMGSISRYTKIIADNAFREQDVQLVLIAYGQDDLVCHWYNVLSLSSQKINEVNRLDKLTLSVVAPRKINAVSLDVLHCPLEFAPPYFWLVKAKRIVTILGDTTFTIGREVVPEMFSLGNRLRYFQLRAFRGRVDQFVTESESVKRGLTNSLDIAADRMKVIHLGVDLKVFRPRSEQEVEEVLAKYEICKPYALHISDCRVRKNVPRMMEAFYHIVKEGDLPNFSLVLAGAPGGRHSEYIKVQQIIHQRSLDRRVKSLGYVDDSDLPALYTGATYLVFPSLHEGFGFPIVESMACGTPVLTSEVYAIPEIAGEAAYYVNPYSVEDISKGMIRLARDTNLQRELSEKGLQRARQFTSEESARRHFELYRSVIDGG